MYKIYTWRHGYVYTCIEILYLCLIYNMYIREKRSKYNIVYIRYIYIYIYWKLFSYGTNQKSRTQSDVDIFRWCVSSIFRFWSSKLGRISVWITNLIHPEAILNMFRILSLSFFSLFFPLYIFPVSHVGSHIEVLIKFLILYVWQHVFATDKNFLNFEF